VVGDAEAHVLRDLDQSLIQPERIIATQAPTHFRKRFATRLIICEDRYGAECQHHPRRWLELGCIGLLVDPTGGDRSENPDRLLAASHVADPAAARS
jgi:hypothetical protein